MLVSALEKAGAGELWQPVGERSIAIGAARHVFVSVDNPIRDDSTRVFPNMLIEVVGAHMIDPDWFDRTVAPRCQDESLTFVFYGQAGFPGSLFERGLGREPGSRASLSDANRQSFAGAIKQA